MTRWTIEVDEEVAERVADAAARQGVAPEALAGAAVAEKFGARRRRLAFAAVGASGSPRGAAQADELLAEGFGRTWVLIVDTGPLVATADRDDADHATCRALLEGDAGPLVTSALVVAEAAYLIDRQLGPQAEAALYSSIIDGSLRIEHLQAGDWRRIRELVETYADLRLGGTDASLVAIAERLAATRLATLNHRDFAVVRPLHAEAFTLLP